MKMLVNPGADGIISERGQIAGAPLPPNAVVIDYDGDLTLPPAKAARLKDDGSVEIVADWRGSGPWYDQAASTADRLTPIHIDGVGVDPTTKNWAMAPRPLTKAEKDAEAKAKADADAAAAAAALAEMTVTPVQLRLAANEAGVRTAIEGVVADPDTPQDVRDLWEYATEFKRSHPLWAQFAPLIGKTATDIDALFALAATK